MLHGVLLHTKHLLVLECILRLLLLGCGDWGILDIINRLVASGWSFGRHSSLDLFQLSALLLCRLDRWHTSWVDHLLYPLGLLDLTALSVVLLALLFALSIWSWVGAPFCSLSHSLTRALFWFFLSSYGCYSKTLALHFFGLLLHLLDVVSVDLYFPLQFYPTLALLGTMWWILCACVLSEDSIFFTDALDISTSLNPRPWMVPLGSSSV